MARQYSVTYDNYDNWKLPLNLAIGFHLIVATSVVYLPDIFKSRPKFEDAYEVNLINFSEPAPQPQMVQEPEPVKQAVVEKEVKEDAVSISEPEKITPAPKEAKPISLKPLKRKIKKKIVEKPKPDINRQQELEKLKRQRLAEAIKAEQDAAEQARRAAEEAARQQRLLEQQLNRIKSQVRTTAPASPRSSSSGSSSAQSALSNQYYANVQSHITSYYNLPKFTTWDPSLTTLMTITIDKNGTIVSQRLKQSSGNATFDQFVRKTIQNANPLPAIPPALKENRFDFILTFTPESIKY